MSKRDKLWLFAVVLSILSGMTVGEPFMDWLDSEPPLFVDLNVPAITEPAIADGDTVIIETRWVAREDSARAVALGWIWRGGETQPGKWAVSRRVR